MINYEIKEKNKNVKSNLLNRFLLYSSLSLSFLFNHELNSSNSNSLKNAKLKLEHILNDLNFNDEVNSSQISSEKNIKSKINVYYVPDIHDFLHASKIFIDVYDFSKNYNIDGILLEGFNYGLLNEDHSEKVKYKQNLLKESLKIKIDSLIEEHQKIIDNEEYRNILKSILFTSNLNKHGMNIDFRDRIDTIKRNPENYSFLLNYYINDLFEFYSTKLHLDEKIKEYDEEIGLLCSPGINHLVYPFPLYGIEDFDLYERSIKSNLYSKDNLDLLLEQDFIKENENLSGILTEYNKKYDCNISFDEFLILRDKEVMKNISQLKPGNYILIFGLLHAKSLEEESQKYSEIKFNHLKYFISN